jgi:3-deoxy-D-manno-octulosonic-acid transferase
MLYGAYRFVTDVAAPLLPRWLDARARRGKEDPTRLGERSGVTARTRPEGRLVWFHAASVGEALSILPLVEGVLAKDWRVLMTTGTVTSARLMAERLPAGAIHQYVPLDHGPWVRRFLDHWRPDLVLWTESELWPSTLAEIAVRKIPAVLLNARLSDKSFKTWRYVAPFARRILSAFSLIIAQSDEDKLRFAALGGRNVACAGNLKLAADPLPADDAALADLRALVGKRPHWLASSIHPGEDVLVGETHHAVKKRLPALLSVIVPRHPPKAPEMARQLSAMGLKVARRAAKEPLTAQTDIYIADTMGELGLFYRLCDLVFIGKSLAVGGGQNPAEAAQLGCALLLGPDMSNFRETAADFLARRAAVEVRSGAALIAAVDWLLQDTPARNRMSVNARAAMARHANAVTETFTHLDPYLQAVSRDS